MGRKSIKENKNIYHIKREEMDYSREKAAELCHMSTDRIAAIETDPTVVPRPEEVYEMSNVYEYPNLCNYYCSHQCRIGSEYVPSIELNTNLFEIIVKIVHSINQVDAAKEKLLEIVSDGIITDNELEDFVKIQNELECVSINVETLQLWMEYQTDKNNINRKKFEELKKKYKEM